MERSDAVRLRPPSHRVDRRALGWWTLQAAVFAVPLPLVFGVLYLSIPPARVVFIWAFLTSLVPGIVYTSVMPLWRYRVHRWETTDEAVYSASGWLWQNWRVVPLSRVQTVDTLRGPLQQLFGLSGITVTTASSSGAVKIKGIDHRLARDVVEHLTKSTGATSGDET
ncbi:PH domain-containing protein [Streptomyces sp. NPDC059176]|uniref:PH domain-containing protein n=1 Tax=unclassified Streptomyces TaxID=2593676 RepID=UPI0036B3986F